MAIETRRRESKPLLFYSPKWNWNRNKIEKVFHQIHTFDEYVKRHCPSVQWGAYKTVIFFSSYKTRTLAANRSHWNARQSYQFSYLSLTILTECYSLGVGVKLYGFLIFILSWTYQFIFLPFFFSRTYDIWWAPLLTIIVFLCHIQTGGLQQWIEIEKQEIDLF